MAIKAKKKKVEEAKAPQPTSLIKFGSKVKLGKRVKTNGKLQ